MLTAEIHNEAIQAADEATQNYLDQNGEHPFNCGFAWIEAFVKGNTKLGKSFISQGFDKSYTGGYKLWNPGKSYTQDMSAKMAGCDAYVKIVKKYLPDAPIYTSSRLD
jgi:hypothetical protein|tara:strand:- start:12 stop:335 length:324 start_codon:yes stop_codon:yes gene_type:complete